LIVQLIFLDCVSYVMSAVPLPALSFGGTSCDALMSAVNFTVFAEEGETAKSAAENARPKAMVIVADLRMFFLPESTE
jgi:hypothetical protein